MVVARERLAGRSALLKQKQPCFFLARDIPPEQRKDRPRTVEELIEKAPGLTISRRYKMDQDLGLGTVTQELLSPALAIPVEAKQEYECPDDHLQALKSCLPKITKLLVIGWRASEDRFLDLLAKNLRQDVRVMAVAGGRAGAIGVVNKLKGAGIAGEFSSFEGGGFSAFVLSPEVEAFLRG